MLVSKQEAQQASKPAYGLLWLDEIGVTAFTSESCWGARTDYPEASTPQGCIPLPC